MDTAGLSLPSDGRKRTRPLRPGFTLIELLVAVSIVGLLGALMLAGVVSSRETARKTMCSNNLRQIGVGLSSHLSSFGRFPPQNPSPNNTPGSPFSYQGMSWHSYLLGFIDQQGLRDAMESAFQTDRDPAGLSHYTVSSTVVGIYVCPSDGRLAMPLQDPSGTTAAFTSYVGMTGTVHRPGSGVFGRRTGLSPSQIPDGLGSTILVGERPPPGSLSMGWWYNTHRFPNLMAATDYEVPAAAGMSVGDPGCSGVEIDWPGLGPIRCSFFSQGTLREECDKYHYWSLHKGGANFLLGDGSVAFMRYESRFRIGDMATVDGGEVVGD